MALVDMFLKLTGAEGESRDAAKANQFQIQGFRLNARSPRSATTGEQSGKISFTDMTIYANVEKGTAKLFSLITGNQKIPKAELTCRKAGKEPFEFFKVTMSDCYLSRVDIGEPKAGGGDVIPPCEFDIEFSRIEFQSREQTGTGPTSGPVVAMYDLGKNK